MIDLTKKEMRNKMKKIKKSIKEEQIKQLEKKYKISSEDFRYGAGDVDNETCEKWSKLLSELGR